MSRGLNKVMIIGHVGRDPDLRFTPSGRSVTTFSVATNRSWTSADGERHTETEWFTVVAWGGLAEICKQYLAKGTQVYVEGRLRSRKWEDAEGVKHTGIEIIAQEMMILSEKRDQPHPTPETEEPAGNEEDYPF